jgi:tetratricopeptide (TPR) repeat protein
MAEFLMTEILAHIDDLLDHGELKKAEVAIAKQLRSEPSAQVRSDLLLRRARARLIGQHPDDALEDIQTARALDGERADSPYVLELLADIYFARFELSPVGFAERSDADRALELYEQIEKQHPEYDNLGWILYQRGRVLLTANQTENAIECLKEALLKPSTITPLTSLCYERLGFVHLFDQRDPAAALTFLDRAAVTYPTSEHESWLGQLHILRSRALREKGEYDEALDAAEHALHIMEKLGSEMRGGQQDAHLALGEILARLPDRAADAAHHLQQFLQLGKKPLGVDVTWSRVNELLGDMLFQIGRYEAAVEAYNNALVFNPYHPWQTTLYYHIARSYYRLRLYEKTIQTVQQLQAATEEESQTLTDYRVFHLLGNAYFAMESYTEAVDAYQQAVAIAPKEADDLNRIQTYLRFAQELMSTQ